MDREYREMIFQPLYRAYSNMLNKDTLTLLREEKITLAQIVRTNGAKIVEMVSAVRDFAGGTGKVEEIAELIKKSLIGPEKVFESLADDKKTEEFFLKGFTWQNRAVFFLFSLFRYTGRLICQTDEERLNRDILDNWMIVQYLSDLMGEMGWMEEDQNYIISLLKFMQERFYRIKEIEESPLSVDFLDKLTDMDGFRQLLGLNTYEKTLWFTGERFSQYIWWVFFITLLGDKGRNIRSEAFKKAELWEAAAEKSKYDFKKLIELMK